MSECSTYFAAGRLAQLAKGGETVTYKLASGATSDLVMLPSDPQQLSDAQDGSYKLFGLPVANLPVGAARGDTITRASGAKYDIFSFQTDEAGWTTLTTRKQ